MFSHITLNRILIRLLNSRNMVVSSLAQIKGPSVREFYFPATAKQMLLEHIKDIKAESLPLFFSPLHQAL